MASGTPTPPIPLVEGNADDGLVTSRAGPAFVVPERVQVPAARGSRAARTRPRASSVVTPRSWARTA